MSWAIRALVINELTAERWQYEVAPGVTAGDTIMKVGIALSMASVVASGAVWWPDLWLPRAGPGFSAGHVFWVS